MTRFPDRRHNHDAVRCGRDAIAGRRYQHGYIAEYTLAKALVDRVDAGAHDGDWLASWF